MILSENQGCRSGGAAETALTDRKLSTVVPAVTSGEGRFLRLADIDLALKLHYVRMVYYFPAPSGAATSAELKHPMFRLLTPYYAACARIRVSSSGRPFLKCNDCGVRYVEARCPFAMADWLENQPSPHLPLVPAAVLGPDLSFSPPVAVQFTRFECEGLAIGFSWSHVLGDVATAAKFATSVFRVLSDDPTPEFPQVHKSGAKPEAPPAVEPLLLPRATNTMEDAALPTVEPRKKSCPPALVPPPSVKLSKTVDGCWLPVCETKMNTLSLQIPSATVEALREKTKARTSFEAISAVVWRSLARIRGGAAQEPYTVTLCKFSSATPAGRTWILGNDIAVGVVSASSSPAAADISELAILLAGGFNDEASEIEALAGAESAPPDLVLYGANLTFVDLEDLPLYDVALKGQRPALVNCTVEGVGGEGCVMVLRGAAGSDGARTVTAVLPSGEVAAFESDLQTVLSLS